MSAETKHEYLSLLNVLTQCVQAKSVLVICMLSLMSK